MENEDQEFFERIGKLTETISSITFKHERLSVCMAVTLRLLNLALMNPGLDGSRNELIDRIIKTLEGKKDRE